MDEHRRRLVAWVGRHVLPHERANVQLGVEGAGWRAAIYATNLFDERTDTLSTPVGGPNAGDERLVVRPRTIGAFFRRDF